MTTEHLSQVPLSNRFIDFLSQIVWFVERRRRAKEVFKRMSLTSAVELMSSGDTHMNPEVLASLRACRDNLMKERSEVIVGVAVRE